MYESDERIWENRADKFFNEGGVVGSPQQQELWAVVERFRAVSYTHLDVYKRQQYHGLNITAFVSNIPT